jgi:predicted  nucleic acid-binding Zn-ribbon protein
LAKKDTEMASLKSEREEIAELLTDTQESLNAHEANAMQREEERRRLELIIQDQRSTLQALEEQLLAAKYSSDLSYQSINFDNIKIQ